MTDTIPDNYSADFVGQRVRAAARKHSMSTERSQQQSEHRIGASEIGFCREYLRHMTIQTPYDDVDELDEKWPAFIGSAVGDRLEDAYMESHPDAIAQQNYDCTLPSGRVIKCHPDLIDPNLNAVIDEKGKNGLEAVKRQAAPDRSHDFQIKIYTWGAMQNNLLKENARAFLVYHDRSGKTAEQWPVEVIVNYEAMQEIDAWLDDVEYAVRNNEPAKRDREFHFCEIACSFFFSCRGIDSYEGGLIEDEDAALLAKMYLEGAALEKEGKELKSQAKTGLAAFPTGFIPSIGKELVRTQFSETQVPGYTRSGYETIRFTTPKVREPTKKEIEDGTE